ncbi:MAG: bifunctional YncE family protein/alkaline phosphatase family protein [Bryobacteraceae bacterium]
MLVYLLAPALMAAQTAETPVRSVTDPGIVTTRQAITPAGTQSVFRGRVHGVTFGKTSAELWVLNGGQVLRMDWQNNRILDRVPLDGDPGLQGIRYDPESNRLYVSSTRREKVRLLSIANGQAEVVAGSIGRHIAGAVALTNLGLAVVPLIFDDKVALVSVSGGRPVTTASTGIAPFAAVVNKAGTVAYVSNWGGRQPKSGDLTAPTGLSANADQVVVDARGIASTGSVTRIDLASSQVIGEIAVGLHPMGLAWDEPRGRIYVANGNSDSISIIDSQANHVVQTISLRPFGVPAFGASPTAIALTRDGTRLLVTCGGLNAVAVVDPRSGKLLGMIPTAWYPDSLAVSSDGKYLAVGTLLGPGSGWKDEPRKRFVHANRGSIAVLPLPDDSQLASYSAAVAENNRLSMELAQAAVPRARRTAPSPIPDRTGEPSLIEHVVYIVKENRTYDQVLGDMPKGNGDPSLVMFGEDVTPNHHRLADQFVLMDNFYASGGNSADGHQWVTQANETAYCLWPGYTGRSYPFDGTDPIAYSSKGFIWNAATRLGKTVRIYGEYAGRVRGAGARSRLERLERWKSGADFNSEWQTTAPIQSLNPILAHNYPAYSTAIPDVIRADIFLADLKAWEKQGRMPNLVLAQLPSDHTYGATPGTSSAKAMVADNDLALGKMIDALTHSIFWKKMAIFVVEDDAQDGVDHVDGHRTVALAISPYVRRGAVDSTFYSHQSILKTIELILGLPTLSLFDMIATDMRAGFNSEARYQPYDHVVPKQSIFEVNPPAAALRGSARKDALDSLKMRFDIPDAAPTERLNRILWRQVRGPHTPYPGAKSAVFAPLSLDVDDDDR